MTEEYARRLKTLYLQKYNEYNLFEKEWPLLI